MSCGRCRCRWRMSILAILFLRMAIHKLPPASMAASSWLALGPIGTGALGLLVMGAAAPAIFGAQGLAEVGAAARGIGVIGGLLLWGYGLWWMASALLITAALSAHRPALQSGLVGLHLPAGRLCAGDAAAGPAAADPRLHGLRRCAGGGTGAVVADRGRPDRPRRLARRAVRGALPVGEALRLVQVRATRSAGRLPPARWDRRGPRPPSAGRSGWGRRSRTGGMASRKPAALSSSVPGRWPTLSRPNWTRKASVVP